MTPDSRHIAVTVLIDSEKSRNVLDQSLKKFANNLDKLSQKDRALANSIIFGTLRYRGKIDWIIKPFSNKILESLDPIVIWSLRIALFQIMFMDKIPVSAAVNTAVNVVKSEAGRGAANFTNAVLRKASRNFNTVTLPDNKKDPALYLSVEFSIPLWLSKKWVKRYGFKVCMNLCTAINTIPQITIRTNTLKTTRDEIFQLIKQDIENPCFTEYANDGISFTKPAVPIHNLKGFKEGLFQVQDQAAQITTLLLNPKPGETILDACAGNGGKTAHTAQLMSNRGRIIAIDTSGKRLANLEKETRRLSLDIIEIKQTNILKYNDKSFKNAFDRILVDAPCTGLGVLRRNPDSKWNKTYKDVKRLAAKQKEILSKTAAFVKPGGIIIFSVCSTEKEENEDVINHFLETNKNFIIDENLKKKYAEQCGKKDIEFFFTEDGFFKSYPHAPFMDGFFVAGLIKKQ